MVSDCALSIPGKSLGNQNMSEKIILQFHFEIDN